MTDTVLAVSDRLELVCRARGGPVNIDADAVTARGLPLVITPGKNVVRGGHLTLAFRDACPWTACGPALSRPGPPVKDNWEGARFIGSDLPRLHTRVWSGTDRSGSQSRPARLPFGVSGRGLRPPVR